MAMRFIHTGDWHLGRQLYNMSLLDDQSWWLDRFVALVAEEQPDAVVIAGDVYDRAVPPADAVELLDATITRIVRDLGVPVLMVAGNHDSPERVGFGARMLDAAGLHVAGALEPQVRSVVLGDGADATRFWLLPYADPIETRAALAEADCHDHEAAVAACLARILGEKSTEPHQVLVTHHFVAGGLTSDSERALTVGGTGAVSAGLFGGFDFVALGHLHRRQTLAGGRVHYAGSALAYAFDESTAMKAVSVVELGDGAPAIREVSLGARRAMRRLTGAFDELFAQAAFDDARDDYLEVVLSDPAIPPDALGRLREFYPNLLRLGREVEFFEPDAGHEPDSARVERMTDEELFERFFSYVTAEDLAPAERAVLHELLAEQTHGEQS